MGGDGTGDASGDAGRDATVEITTGAAEPPDQQGTAAEDAQAQERAEPADGPADAGDPTASIPEQSIPRKPAVEASTAVQAPDSVTGDQDRDQDGGPATAAAASTPAREDAGRSAVAAALLNLTGLGLGYLYLRCRLRAVACFVIFALMVVVAFANDASSSPWLWRILAAAWAVATTVDAWAVARRRPAVTWAEALRPIALGAVAVLVLVAGHIGYAGAARATYAVGMEAQGRADCTAANRSFDAVTGPYELTLSRDVPAAAQRRGECTDFLVAQQAEQAGSLAEAVASYRAFRQDHAGSVLDPFASDGTRRVLQAWAVSLRGTGDLDGAIGRYGELLQELGSEAGAGPVREDLAATHVERATAARATMAAAAGPARVDAMRAAMEDLLLVQTELPDTSSAAGMPQAILDTYGEANSAFAEGRFCDALPVLDYAVTLPGSAGVGPVAHGDRARSLSECGLASFAAGDYTGATDRFRTLVTDYPDDPGVAQARSAVITAEVGQAAGVSLPLPAPLGAPASEPVVVYNAAATEVRVLIAGPVAQEVTLPACPGCPASYPTGVESCPGAAGRPSSAIRLRPGTYYVLQDRSEFGPSDSVNDPINVQSGGGELCVTVTSTR
jgi:hypothetical protein